MSGLRTVTPEERLLETMRLIQEYTSRAKGGSGQQVWSWATDAIAEYEATKREVRTANSLVVMGEIHEAK